MASIPLPLFGALAQGTPKLVKQERQRANSNANAKIISVSGHVRSISRPKSEMPLVSVQESFAVEPLVLPGATIHANTPTLGYANELAQKGAPSPTTSADALGHDHRASVVLSQTHVVAESGSLFVPVTALGPAPNELAPRLSKNEDEDEYEYDDLLLDLDVDVEAGGDGVSEEKGRERRRAKDRRIRRWLEQQCRFVLDVEEGGWEGSGSEAESGTGSGSSGEEELSGNSSDEEVVKERKGEGDQAHEGDSEARDVVGCAKSLPPPPDFPLTTPATTTPCEELVIPSTSALPGSSSPAGVEVDISPYTNPDADAKTEKHPNLHMQPQMRSEGSQSDRADSPLLGYPSSMGSESCSSLLGISSSHLNVLSSSGVASTSGSRSRPRSRLRAQGHGKTSSDGMSGSIGVGVSTAEDPLRYPARNYVRVLSEGGEGEWEGVSVKRRKRKAKGKDGKKERRGKGKGSEMEANVDYRRDDKEEEDARLALAACIDGRDKPLPPPPAVSPSLLPSPNLTSTSTSSPEAEAEPAVPHARTSAHAHTPSEALSLLSISTTKTTVTLVSPPTSTNTSQANTPESSFSVPTSVSTPCTSAGGSFSNGVSGIIEGENKGERTRKPSAASRASFSYSGTTPIPLPLSLLRSQSQGVIGLVNASTNSNSNVNANAKRLSQLPLGPGPPSTVVQQHQHQRSVSAISTSSVATSSVSVSRQSSQSGPHSHSHSSRSRSISRTGSISNSKAMSISLSRKSSVSHSHTGSSNEGAGAPVAILPVSDTVATSTSTTTLSRRPSMLLLMCPPSLPGLGEEDAGVSVGASPTRTLPASQFHLPTAMLHLRRSESLSQMQQQMQIQMQQQQQAAVISPLPPNMPPTRRQSRAGSLSASMVIAGAGASVYTVDSSTAPSRTRSRAGSLSLAQTLAQSFGESGSSLDRGSGSGGSVDHGARRESTAETPEEEGGDVVRNAVYIDSEEVRERLDVLIGRAKEREEDGYASDELFLAYHDGEEQDQDDEDSFVSGARVRRSLRPSPPRPPPAPPLDLNAEQNRTQNQEQGHSGDMTIGMSMSRWSLASSAMDEEEKGKPPGKEKERRSLIPTEPSGTGRSSSEKKRGRLVSFISRLSAAVAPSLPSTPTTENGGPVPPVPSTPPLPSPPASSHLPLSFDVHAQMPTNGQSIPSIYAQRPRAFTTSVSPNPPKGVPMGVGERGRSNSAADLLALGANQRQQQLQQYQNQEQHQLPTPISPSGPYYPPQNYPGYNVQNQHPTVYHQLGGSLVKSASASILRSPPGQYQGAHVQIAQGPTPRRSNLQLRRRLSGREGDGNFGHNADDDEEEEDEEEREEEEEEEDYGVVLAKKDSWRGEWEGREEATGPGYPTSPVVLNIPANLAPISPVSSPVDAQSPLPPLPLAPLHRLKSLPSLVNLNLSLLSNASASGSTNPTSPPPLSAPLPGQSKDFPNREREKGKGFIGFVQRIGRNKNSNHNNTNLNVSIPDAGASRAQIISVSGHAESADGSVASSPAHSPNSSIDRNELRAYNDATVGTPVEVEDDQSTRSPTASTSIGSGLLASFNLSKPNKPLSASKALGGGGPKRKLCISGVALDDTRAMEVVRAWCESFGEVKQMTRSADGSLLVDFKKASVAETVCRIQAQVFIKGVGSVTLSWFTKRKPIL